MPDTDYFLHVNITVPEDKHLEYERLVTEFVAEPAPFKRFSKKANYSLDLALRSKDPFQFQDSPQAWALSSRADFSKRAAGYHDSMLERQPMVHQYVHVWSVPDIDDLDLARLMMKVADYKPYMDINSLILREEQVFVRKVKLPGALDDRGYGKNFVRLTRRFESKGIGPYLFKAGALVPELKRNGWYPLGQYQNVTGALNVVTEFWETDEPTSLESMMKAFTGYAPRLRELLVDQMLELIRSERREALTIASYAPKRSQSARSASVRAS